MKRSVITCDMEGRVLTMNKGAEDIFGYKKDEIIGKKEFQYFHLVRSLFKTLEIGWQPQIKLVNLLVKHIF